MFTVNDIIKGNKGLSIGYNTIVYEDETSPQQNIIKTIVTENEFTAISYTKSLEYIDDGEVTHYNLQSFIKLNKDGIILCGTIINLLPEQLPDHGIYINLPTIDSI